MKVYITGVSKGLGKALTAYFLEHGAEVVGIGRSHTFDHPHFSFINCDLRDLKQVKNVKFSTGNHDEILLINNAGVIGNIERITDQETPDMEEVMTINTLAPMLLMRNFMLKLPEKIKLTIINISSGAANRAVPSWASYCASKIALDRFSETFFLEEQEKGRKLRVLSVAPGVVDTPMQEKIRTAKSGNFSSLSQFIELKENGKLFSLNTAVDKFIKLLNKDTNNQVVWSLRDIQ